jgi:acetyltransferase-like isoleucine patch superfamily enzyme
LKRWLALLAARLVAPRIIYGYRRADGTWLAHTRISSHACIEHPEGLDIGDHVFVGHFNMLDASSGLAIGEGCQITNHVSILSHSSHQAVRLMGRGYFGHLDPTGYVRGATRIGAYCFIGPHSVIAPGAQLGRGVLVQAYSYVRGEVPDFAIVAGQPARVVGDTRDADRPWLERDAKVRALYEAWAGTGWARRPAPGARAAQAGAADAAGEALPGPPDLHSSPDSSVPSSRSPQTGR